MGGRVGRGREQRERQGVVGDGLGVLVIGCAGFNKVQSTQSRASITAQRRSEGFPRATPSSRTQPALAQRPRARCRASRDVGMNAKAASTG